MDCGHCLRTIDEPDLTDLERVPCPHCGHVTNLLSSGEPRAGERFGNFILLGDRPLGTGGNGAVWAARDERLNRRVAIKFPLHARGPEAERLQREAKAVAALKHPHIVPVYHLGEANGRCYIVSELVSGRSLDKELDACGTRWRASPQSAARLVAPLAEALAHAHERGVIHRDVKPSNIMLDEAGEPRLLDFGISRSVDSDNRTRTGETPYSPLYLSPEQALGNSAAVTSQTDIYSLGVVLFELLTGRLPFTDRPKDPTASFDVGALTKNPLEPAPSVRRFNRRIPRDLETICACCLEKSPLDRYARAADLAHDLRSFLAGEPIKARPVSPTKRFVLWCRRRPLVAGLSAVAILAAIIAVSFFLRGRELQSEVAVRQEELSGTRAALAKTKSSLEAQREFAQQKTLDALIADERRRHQTYVTALRTAPDLYASGRIVELRSLLQSFVPENATERDFRGFEWHYWIARARASELRIPLNEFAVRSLAWTSDQHVGCECRDGQVRIMDLTRQETVSTLGGKLANVSFSRDGRFVAGVGPAGFTVWNTASHKPVVQRPVFRDASVVALNADGSLAAMRIFDDLLVVQLPEVNQKARWTDVGPLSCLAFSQDSRWLAGSVPSAGGVRVFDLTDRSSFGLGGARGWVAGLVTSLEFNPDGNRLACASVDGLAFAVQQPVPGEIHLFDFTSRRTERILRRPVPLLNEDRTTPAAEDDRLRGNSGDYRATFDRQSVAMLYPLNNAVVVENGPQAGERRLLHDAAVISAAFSPDGKRVASAAEDRTLRIWDLAARDVQSQPVLLPPGEYFSVRQDAAVVMGFDAKIRVNSLTGGKPFVVTPPMRVPGAVALSPEGDRIAGGGGIWRVGKSEPEVRLEQSDLLERLQFTQQGPHLIGVRNANGDRRLQIWDVSSGKLVWRWPNDSSPPSAGSVKSGAMHEPTRVHAVGSEHGQIHLFDNMDAEPAKTWDAHEGAVLALAFSPDGSWLVSGGVDGVVRVWKTNTGERLREQRGHTREITAITFTSDGQRMATGSGAFEFVKTQSGEIIVWDSVTGLSLLQLSGVKPTLFDQAVFCANDRLLIATGIEFGERIPLPPAVITRWDTRDD